MLAQHMALRQPQLQWWCPQLPASPSAAMALVLDETRRWPRASMAVIGSSLGGFYASAVAESVQCKAVLLNPAVDPARDLASYVGEQPSWHDPQQYLSFLPEFISELRALTGRGMAQPQNYLVLIAKGDELLDWREMQARYAGAQIALLEGGDHALSDFEAHLPTVLAFLGLD